MSDEVRVNGRDKIGAVVLAAGRSARMGEAKQLLRVNGRTLLEQALTGVPGSDVNAVVLVLGYAAEQIQRELSPELLGEVTIVVNKSYEEGMSSSVRVGLAALGPQIDAALVVLADQPLVKPETMCSIIRTYKHSSAEIVVPHYKGKRGNPVLLDRAVFPEAMKLEGDTGFRAIFSSHAAGLLPFDVDDEGVVLDIDSREDYERVQNRTS